MVLAGRAAAHRALSRSGSRLGRAPPSELGLGRADSDGSRDDFRDLPPRSPSQWSLRSQLEGGLLPLWSPSSRTPPTPGSSRWGQALAVAPEATAGVLKEAEAELLQEVRASAEIQLAAQERAVQRFLERLAEPGGSGAEARQQQRAGPPAEEEQGACRSEEPHSEDWSTAEQTRALNRKLTMEYYSDRMRETIHHKDYHHSTAGILLHKEATGWFPSKVMRWLEFFASFQEPERSGRLADLVQSSKFELTTLAMIMLNGAFVVFQTQRDGKIAISDPTELQGRAHSSSFDFIVDQLFTLYFTVELVLRLIVHRAYFFCNEDCRWNIFDFATIMVTLLDALMTYVGGTGDTMDVNFLRLLRIFRMARSLRILRALHFVRPLRSLMECMVSSLTSVIWSLLLIVFVTTIFATFLCQCLTSFLLERDPSEATTLEMEEDLEVMRSEIGTVSSAAFTLFKTTSGGGDWGDYYRVLCHTGVVAPAVVVMYILFFLIAAWNIVTSLFLEKALAIAKPDLDQQLLDARQQDIDDAHALKALLQDIDADGNGLVSLREFKLYLCKPRVRMFFELRNIDVKDAEMFFLMLQMAEESDEVELDTLVSGLLRMRGLATNMDLQALLFQINMQNSANQYVFDDIALQLGGISRRLQAMPARAPAAAAEEGKGGGAAAEAAQALEQDVNEKLMDAPPIPSRLVEQDKLIESPPKLTQADVGPSSEALKLVQDDISTLVSLVSIHRSSANSFKMGFRGGTPTGSSRQRALSHRGRTVFLPVHVKACG